ncbi:MAG: hypothetical protein IH949_13745, partial [Bacteroidetes bacterium]|nr:hypothetical protein [Bacteroidota bacterium]
MINNNNKTVLICTVGGIAPVVSETLLMLQKKTRSNISTLVIVHTNSKLVISNKTVKGKEIGLKGLKSFLKQKYPSLKIILVNLKMPDILSHEDNDKVLSIFISTLIKYKNYNQRVYVGIAGGRKTMSALALFAAYLIGTNGIYHVLIQGDEKQLTEKYGFDIPSKYLHLIEIPNINLGKVFNSVFEDVDTERKYDGNFDLYLKDKKGDYTELFEKLNLDLASNLNLKKIKSTYEIRYNDYLQMCQSVESILNSYVKKLKIMAPKIQYRVKSFNSIIEKIFRKQEIEGTIVDPFVRFSDIAGVEIVCFFTRDAKLLCGEIEKGSDFLLIKKPDKKGEIFSYKATHYDVTLKKNRISLIE